MLQNAVANKPSCLLQERVFTMQITLNYAGKSDLLGAGARLRPRI